MRGPYKKQALDVLKDRQIPVGTIFDVGVLDGTPELMDAFPDTKHVLFEPVEEFREHIELTYKNVPHELHTVALSDSSGEATLQVRTILSNRSISHSNLVQDQEGEDFRKVQMVSLDDFIAGRTYAKPYLLKIDVDGHELQIIKGAKAFLADTSVVIIETPKSELVERIAAVQSEDFELFDLAEPVYYDESFWQCDAILIKKNLQRSRFRQLNQSYDPSLYREFVEYASVAEDDAST